MKFTTDEKFVKVLGRSLMKDGVRYLNYSCAALEFIFTGTKAEAILWTDSYTMGWEYRAWVAVFVNDEEKPSKRFSLEKEEDTYVLFEGAQVQETKIRLVKYSEVAFGKVGIKSIVTYGDKPPIPTAVKARKLEFIGDSITCGYGNEGMLNIDTFNTTQENPWEAYAARTARALDADYHLISWSGIGIISNWTDQEIPNDEWLMPELYPYTDKATDIVLGNMEPEIWDNNRFKPDCIIINLGTNDASYTKNISDRVETFGRKYYDFLKQVRTSNPTTKILCTLGVMGQDLCDEIQRQVEHHVSEGDDKIYFMKFDLQSEQDGIGADWHPSILTHEKMAKKLVGELKKILAIE
ncbi:MAG: lipolytic protein family [Herbinix sp.]|jgi:lysophospholipase L1-like esterase|nr:lipolytic protein family [Herbinix sp.]